MKTGVGSAAEDYLKTIYKLSMVEDRVTPTLVSNRLGVSVPAVMKMSEKLRSHRFLLYSRREGVRLTPEGTAAALEVLRHHRLIELYLVEALGYTWDEVHEEAERLEHAISERFEEKIDRLLGRPLFDPHGDPIPRRDGTIDKKVYPSLIEVDGGEVSVRRVTDGNAGLLRRLGALGLYPGADVEVLEKPRDDEGIHLLIGGRKCQVDPVSAENVFVYQSE